MAQINPVRHTLVKRTPLEHAIKSFKGDMGLAGTVIWIAILAAFALFFFLPLLWFILAPSKIDSQLVDWPPLSFGAFSNYAEAWMNLNKLNEGVIFLWAKNSLLYSGSSLVLALAVSIPAGYALAVADFAGRRFILTATLVMMILPGSALVLPLFLEMNLFGLLDTPWAVILPTCFFPFGVYLAYIFYLNSLPKDLLAAGRVDGCSEWQLFWYIGLPLSRTILALLAFVIFTATWNNYFLPFVMLNDSSLFSLPLGLQNLLSNTPALNPVFAANDSPVKRPEAALTALIMVIPIAIVFMFSQRYVAQGALTGAVKE